MSNPPTKPTPSPTPNKAPAGGTDPSDEPTTEIELKLAIRPADDLGRLLAALPAPSRVVDQHNFYFRDPAGVLAHRRIMLRVRGAVDAATGELNGVRLTVKRRKPSRRRSKDNDVLIAEEREADLDLSHWDALRAGQFDPMALDLSPITFLRDEIGVGPTKPAGTMINRRHVIPWQGYTLEVDRTEFPGPRIEAEIEVETPRSTINDVRGRLLNLASSLAIRLEPQPMGKYARFRQYRDQDAASGAAQR